MEKRNKLSSTSHRLSAWEISGNRRGLTLFEVLVTLVLAGILMTGAVFIYRDYLDSWDQGLSSLEIQRQGTYALAVMEKTIKQGDGFAIENYGSGTDNKITVTVPTPDGDAKDVEYYWDKDNTQNFKPIKEKDAQEVIIIPDIYREHGESKSPPEEASDLCPPPARHPAEKPCLLKCKDRIQELSFQKK